MKALAKGMMVLLYNGYATKVEDLREGDLVMGDDSICRTIRDVHPVEGTMYKIKPQCDWAEEYTVHSNHTLTLMLSKTLAEISVNTVAKVTMVQYFEHHCLTTVTFQWVKYGGQDGAQTAAEEHLKNAIYNRRGEIVNINVRTFLKQPLLWKTLYVLFQVGVDPAGDVEKREEMLKSPYSLRFERIRIGRSLGYKVSNEGYVYPDKKGVVMSPVIVSQCEPGNGVGFTVSGNGRCLLHNYLVV